MIGVGHQASGIRRQASGVRHRASGVRHQGQGMIKVINPGITVKDISKNSIGGRMNASL